MISSFSRYLGDSKSVSAVVGEYSLDGTRYSDEFLSSRLSEKYMSFNIRCHLAIVVLASLLGWGRTLEANAQLGQSAPAIVPYARDPIERPDKIEILQKLRDHRYAELGSLPSSLQEKHERGEIKEIVVAVAYFSFSNSDPALETDLNQWVEQAPTTYHRGWRAVPITRTWVSSHGVTRLQARPQQSNLVA
jgi:hypothetical protein